MSKALEDKLDRIVDVTLEILRAGPTYGTPEGELYATFASAGFTLATFQGLLTMMERRKKITRSNHLVKITPKASSEVDIWKGVR